MITQIKSRWDSEKILYECEAPVDMASGLHMRHALENAISGDANLRDANLRDANLRDANLYGADLRDANLYGADLRDANLRNANLYGADLRDANLQGSRLSGASLVGADLRDANLRDANLRDANLRGSRLSGASLVGADLRDAVWPNGITIKKTPLLLFGMRWPVTVLDEYVQIGCQLHKTSEWAAFDDDAIARMDGRTALRFWRQNKVAILALADAHQSTAGTD